MTYLGQTLTYGWLVVRCRFKSGHHKLKCSKEIELNAQNLLTILGSQVNISGEDLDGTTYMLMAQCHWTKRLFRNKAEITSKTS